MKKGLTVLNCPHVLLINKYECRKCCFCKQRASYKLFYSLPYYDRSEKKRLEKV
ncbi:hypothetical protein US8_03890 [Bacillus altitudinis]|nr:hypothetical protein US8_03890 [Bacillus altitudinis]